jgi:type IV secretory pathway TrbD component
MNKAMIDSYLRNLLGVVLALVTTAMANAGVASPLDLAASEWLTVLNGVWAAAIPTVIRYLNKKDPAFGKVAEAVAAEVSKKIEAEAIKAAAPKKAPAAKPAETKTTAPKKPASPGKGTSTKK